MGEQSLSSSGSGSCSEPGNWNQHCNGYKSCLHLSLFTLCSSLCPHYSNNFIFTLHVYLFTFQSWLFTFTLCSSLLSLHSLLFTIYMLFFNFYSLLFTLQFTFFTLKLVLWTLDSWFFTLHILLYIISNYTCFRFQHHLYSSAQTLQIAEASCMVWLIPLCHKTMTSSMSDPN